MEHDSVWGALYQDLGQTLNVIRSSLLFDGIEVIDCQEKVGITCGVDERFGQEFVGGVHHVEGFLEAEMVAEAKIIGAILEADHDKGETEGDGTVSGAFRTGRRSRPVMRDGGLAGDRIVSDTEEQAVLVSNGVELELDLLDQAWGAVIAFWDLDGEKMRIALIVRGIQTEHRILLGSREMVVPVGDLDGGDTGFDDILVRMCETVEEVSGWLLDIFTEAGVDVEDVSAEVIGVHDGILAIDLCGFDVEHGAGGSGVS